MLTGPLVLVLDVVDNAEEVVLLVRDVLVTGATSLVDNVDVEEVEADVLSVKHIIQ